MCNFLPKLYLVNIKFIHLTQAINGENDTTNAENDEYSEEVNRKRVDQQERNRIEFGEEGEHARLRHEGLRQGVYVRLVIKSVPVEFCTGFKPENPVIVGGLQPHESTMGVVHVRNFDDKIM